MTMETRHCSTVSSSSSLNNNTIGRGRQQSWDYTRECMGDTANDGGVWGDGTVVGLALVSSLLEAPR